MGERVGCGCVWGYGGVCGMCVCGLGWWGGINFT